MSSTPAGWLDPIIEVLGEERDLAEVTTRLRDAVRMVQAPVVGAVHITCSDEAQHETHSAFQRGFADDLLPPLKHTISAPMRTTNLAGRHEWGAITVAENHYADAGGDWKLMVIRNDAHVAVTDTPDGPVYGSMRRYLGDSGYCGALHAVLADEPPRWPAIDDLRDRFDADGVDRIGALRNEVPDGSRLLMAAVCHARLTARQAMLEIRELEAESPTLYLLLPTVTVNRPDHDTALVVGAGVADHLGAERTERYVGLGDRPEQYRLHQTPQGARVDDDDLAEQLRGT